MQRKCVEERFSRMQEMKCRRPQFLFFILCGTTPRRYYVSPLKVETKPTPLNEMVIATFVWYRLALLLTDTCSAPAIHLERGVDLGEM